MTYIKPIFGRRGTDKLPFTTNARCAGSGAAVTSEGAIARCPRCLRHVAVSPKSRVLRAHTV